MANFCRNCGKELEEGDNFCEACGTKAEPVVNQNITNKVNNLNQTRPVVQKRNIALAVILSLVTCGIYSIYWFICITDDSNMLSDEKTASGGMAFLYSLITCGIYSIYWHYKTGKKMTNAGKKYNKSISDNSVLYLILTLLGFGIVNYCLIQNDLNNFAE